MSVRDHIATLARGEVAEPSGDSQADVNRRVWSRGKLVDHYANRQLRPVEVVLLSRYRDELAGRTLELGSGGGRLTGYLAQVAREARGLELAAAMVQYARGRYPDAHFDEGDLRDLSRYTDGAFDAVIASWNVLDVLGDAERRRVLAETHRILSDGGLLVLSTHNRAAAAHVPPPTHVRRGHPLHLIADVVRMPRRVSNHRRLARGEVERPDYAIVNDSALDYSLLHYYIAPAVQARHLAELGFELLECLDLDGGRVDVGQSASADSELHYVARRVRADSASPPG